MILLFLIKTLFLDHSYNYNDTLTFSPGTTSLEVTINIIINHLTETREMFHAELENPKGAMLGSTKEAVISVEGIEQIRSYIWGYFLINLTGIISKSSYSSVFYTR